VLLAGAVLLAGESSRAMLASARKVSCVLWCEVVSPCYRRWCNNLNEPLDPFPFFEWLLNKKAASVEVNISLTFLYRVGIALHP